MSLVDSVAVAAAERLESAMGAGAALSSYRALARRAGEGDARGRALAGVLRCALSTKNGEALREAVAAWPRAGGGDHIESVIATCKALARRGDMHLAVGLSSAEILRHRTARALYLRARTLELAGDLRAAADALGEACQRAEREGALDIVAAAQARGAELRVRFGGAEGAPAAASDVAMEHLAGEDPRRVLAFRATTLAEAMGRFARASALGSVEELARAALARGDRAGAEAAILVSARHADAQRDALTALEADRIGATVRLWPDAGQAAAALARLGALLAIASAQGAARDEAIVRAADVAPEIAPDVDRARASLSSGSLRVAELGRAFEADGSPATWTTIRLALANRDPDTVREAARAARALLAASRATPPRGWLPLARALTTAGVDDVAELALRRAHAAREPGANGARVHALLARGWALAARGDHEAALVALRAAKALAARGR